MAEKRERNGPGYKKLFGVMWWDKKFRMLSALPCSGQSLWITLIAGPRVATIPGLVVGTPEEIAAFHRWSFDETRAALKECIDLHMVQVDDMAGLMWLPNALEYNAPSSINQCKSWGAQFEFLPECDLRDEAASKLHAGIHELSPAFASEFANAYVKAMREEFPYAKDLGKSDKAKHAKSDDKPHGMSHGKQDGIPHGKAHGMSDAMSHGSADPCDTHQALSIKHQSSLNTLSSTSSTDPPTEKSNSPVLKPTAADAEAEIWNKACDEFPDLQMRRCQGDRLPKTVTSHRNARRREFGSDEEFTEAVQDRVSRVFSSPWHTGRDPASAWQATLPWVLSTGGWEKSAAIPLPRERPPPVSELAPLSQLDRDFCVSQGIDPDEYQSQNGIGQPRLLDAGSGRVCGHLDAESGVASTG